MKIITNARGVHLTEQLKAHIGRRIYFEFARFSAQIRQIQIVLRDINGPKGGIDKICQINIRMRRFNPITIKQIDNDIFRAFNVAADRGARTVARKLDRILTQKHKTKYFKGERYESQESQC